MASHRLMVVLAAVAGSVAVSSMVQGGVIAPYGPASAAHIISASWAGGSWSGPGTYFGANDNNVDQGYRNDTVPIGLHDGRYSAQVFAFALPAMAVGETFTDASVSVVHAFRDGPPNFNVPLSVIGVMNRGWEVQGDYEAAATTLQSDFLTTSSAGWTRISSSAAANTSLVSYLGSSGNRVGKCWH